jgi:hypothetical protein
VAPLGQVLAPGNQTLVNGAGQQGDAVPADLVAEVLTGDTDGTGAGWFEDVPLQVIPLLCGGGDTGDEHRDEASTPVLVAVLVWGQGWITPSTQNPKGGGQSTHQYLNSNLSDRSPSALADRREDRINLVSQFQIKTLRELGGVETPRIRCHARVRIHATTELQNSA